MNSQGKNQPVKLAEYSSNEEEAMCIEHSISEASSKASAASSESVIAQDETTAVNRSKCVVYLVLLITAAAMGTAAYFYVSKGEQKDFESEVRNVSNTPYRLYVTRDSTPC